MASNPIFELSLKILKSKRSTKWGWGVWSARPIKVTILANLLILFHHWFPLLEKVEIRAFILPRNFPAVLIIFTGRGGAGNPPFPTVRGGAGRPSLTESIPPSDDNREDDKSE